MASRTVAVLRRAVPPSRMLSTADLADLVDLPDTVSPVALQAGTAVQESDSAAHLADKVVDHACWLPRDQYPRHRRGAEGCPLDAQ